MSFARQTIRGRSAGASNRPSKAPSSHKPPLSGRTIRVLIQTANGRVVAVEPDSSDTVGRLKQMVESKVGGGIDQSLTFDGRELLDTKTLDVYNIKIGSRLKQTPGMRARGTSPTRQQRRGSNASSAEVGGTKTLIANRPAWGAGSGAKTAKSKTKRGGIRRENVAGRFTPIRAGPSHVDETLFGNEYEGGGGEELTSAAYTNDGADRGTGSNSPAWPSTQRTNRTLRQRTSDREARASSASSSRPSSVVSSRPSSAASSRAGTSRRSRLNPGKPQVKSKAYIDETLFGEPTVQSAEALHKAMWAGSKPFWKQEAVDAGPKRPKARASTRCDFGAPVDMPAGPAPDPRRFAKTKTLAGGQGVPYYAKPCDNKPAPIGKSLIAHQPHRPSRPAKAGPLSCPFVHNHNDFQQSAKPSAKLNNTLWENMPLV